MQAPAGTFRAAARWLRDDMRNGGNADEAPPMRPTDEAQVLLQISDGTILA
jgi:hypothetical protein